MGETDCVSTHVRERVMHVEPISFSDQEASKHQTVHGAHKFRPGLLWVLAVCIAEGRCTCIIESSQDFIQGFIPEL